MTQTYTQIVKQIESLQRKADEARAKEVAGVVGRIKDAIAFYKLSADELGLTGGASARPSMPTGGRKAAVSTPVAKKKMSKSKLDLTAKFRDAAGNEWVGRGPRPLWLREAIASGKSLSDYAVNGAASTTPKSPTPSAPLPKAAKARKKRRARKAPVAKYKDSATGSTWSGRGRKPGWFSNALAAGQAPESMAV